MNILIGCEYSAIVRTAFENKGHNAYSLDLLPSAFPGNHYQRDILEFLQNSPPGYWDLIGLHIPCTEVALSGNRHYGEGMPLYQKRKVSMLWTWRIINAARAISPRVYYENPANVMGRMLGKRTQSIQPWQFGHPEQKATWLWLWGLEPLKGTKNVFEEMMQLPKCKRERIFHMTPSDNRGLERSRTFPGIAAAMADQWG
jgi:hypothetical protein